MKAKIRIPTKEYAYIELEVDEEPDEIVQIHDLFCNLTQDKGGLNQKEWAQVRNKYITTGEISVEDYESLSRVQSFVINEIKKTLKYVNQG